jgi:dihydrofolate reductase
MTPLKRAKKPLPKDSTLLLTDAETNTNVKPKTDADAKTDAALTTLQKHEGNWQSDKWMQGWLMLTKHYVNADKNETNCWLSAYIMKRWRWEMITKGLVLKY